MPFHSRVGLLLALLLAAATPAVAQSNAEVNAGIQFDFSLPGARSLAMGGAFVGLADDATAAWANPAGLTILNKKEVSAEFRGWNFTNFTTDRGHGFGVPSGIGADTVAGLLDTEFEDSTASLAFLSFVYPQPRWSVAAYRHQLSNFQARVQSSGPFLDSGGDIDRADPFAANLRLKIVDYGVSFGFRVTSRLSVGAGLGLHDFSNRLGHRPLSLRAAQSSPGRPAQCVHRLQARGLVRPISRPTMSSSSIPSQAAIRPWRSTWAPCIVPIAEAVGAAVRQGPDFNFSARHVAGVASPRATPTGGAFAIGQLLDEEDLTFAVPDLFAIGGAFRPSASLLLSVE